MPSAEFTAAADEVKNLPQKPADAELLELYALFKVFAKLDEKVEFILKFSNSKQQ